MIDAALLRALRGEAAWKDGGPAPEREARACAIAALEAGDAVADRERFERLMRPGKRPGREGDGDA
ncbi:MAG: hypothetical protein AAF192_20775 [Pseudomonadota bacterium]